jgi:hypothetical protein
MKWIHLMIIVLVSVVTLSATTINVPADAATIQAGIDAAVDGDSVLVSSGTYIENVNFQGKNIVVYSENGAELTTIDGGGLGSVVTFASQEDNAILDGFTITNGRGILNDENHYIGGGIICRFGSSPTLRNLIVEGNFVTGDTSMGGGIMCSYQSDALIEDVIIRDNAADYGGGFVAYRSSPTLKRVEIYENNGRTTGGGVALWDSTTYFQDVLIHSNTAFYLGAGFWAHDHAIGVLNKVTIANNSCTGPPIYRGGGGIELSDGAWVKLVNSILWGNQPNQVEYYSGATYADSRLDVDYSAIQNGELGIDRNGAGDLFYGSDNIMEDPLFGPNYTLAFGSPCIDAGTPFWEVDGATIIDMAEDLYVGIAPDIGAFEYPSPSILDVPADFATIQLAIEAAIDGDTVLVADGTYEENINFMGKNIGVKSVNGETVTTIRGDGTTSTVLIMNQEATAVLDGFTITNGIGYLNADGHYVGGGIAVRYSSTPTLKNLIVEGNHAIGDTSMGGGISCAWGADALIEDVIIRNNDADFGGGFFAYFSNPTLRRMKVHGNNGRTTGGGLTFWGSEALVNEVAVYENTATYDGAGVWVHENGHPTLDQVTITDNTIPYLPYRIGAGIALSFGSELTLKSSIVWNNVKVGDFGFELNNNIEFYSLGFNNLITILYSDIQDGEAGIVTNDNGTINYALNNISMSPMFVDPGVDNYNLQQGSPCIGTGYLGVDMGAGSECMVLDVDPLLMFMPKQFELYQNYPNPFNPATSINFELPDAGWVKLVVYDLAGREVAVLIDGQKAEGGYSISWVAQNQAGKPLATGIYLYELKFTDTRGEHFREVRKFTLLK